MALFFFLDATVNYFLQQHYGLPPDSAVVWQSIFNTTPIEVKEFFAHNLHEIGKAVFTFIVITGCTLFGLGRLSRVGLKEPMVSSRRWEAIVAVSTLIFIALHFNPTMRNANPVAYWPIRYLDYQENIAHFKHMQILMKNSAANMKAWMLQDKTELERTVVLVIGESANRDNWSLYGYQRKTTPKLDAIRNEIIVFRDVISPAPSTQESLKMMLTPATLTYPDRWQTHPNVLMLAKSVGYKVFWLSNQTYTTYADSFVNVITENADVKTFANSGGYNSSTHDGVLLPHVAEALSDPAPLKLIVVHLLGQHGGYAHRYPPNAAVFDASDDEVAQSMRSAGRSQAIIKKRDEYDNATLYGDQVLANLIDLTATASKDVPTALLYVSDHGQEVGHNRDFSGHAPHDESGYIVPALLWVSADSPLEVDKVELEARPYQTDKLDATLLGLLKIASEHDQPQYDLLGRDFVPFNRTINGYPYQPGQPVQPAS